MTKSIIWVVETLLLPLPKSGVLAPEERASDTADSIKSASSECSNEYLSIIVKLKTWARGFAMPFPVMSGAEPWTGSYIAFLMLLLYLVSQVMLMVTCLKIP